MLKDCPLVSIGIPTYNRAALITRTIDSALNQDYKNVEVIVSDNASTDDTEKICASYSAKNPNFKYIRSLKNNGPAENFSIVREAALGDFFMWLGDDDWIDSNYVSLCVERLIRDDSMSLVCGAPKYYRNGIKSHSGKLFDLLYLSWWGRVIAYYARVADNGMFYGVMRTSQIKQIEIPNVMGGDWIMIAELVAMGKAKMLLDVSVHRELGGATASYRDIAKSVGLSKFQVIFPIITIATSASTDLILKAEFYNSRSILLRIAVASIVFFVIIANYLVKYFRAFIRRSRVMIGKLFYRNS